MNAWPQKTKHANKAADTTNRLLVSHRKHGRKLRTRTKTFQHIAVPESRQHDLDFLILNTHLRARTRARTQTVGYSFTAPAPPPPPNKDTDWPESAGNPMLSLVRRLDKPSVQALLTTRREEKWKFPPTACQLNPSFITPKPAEGGGRGSTRVRPPRLSTQPIGHCGRVGGAPEHLIRNGPIGHQITVASQSICRGLSATSCTPYFSLFLRPRVTRRHHKCKLVQLCLSGVLFASWVTVWTPECV